MKITHLLLDLDDTLVNTHKFRRKAISRAVDSMRRAGLRVPREELLQAINTVYKKNPNSPEQFQDALKILKLEFNAKAIAAGVKAYHDLKHDHSRYKPYPQADRLIRFAKSKGIKVRIVSAGWPIKQWDKLWHLGLAKHFENDEVFVTGDSRISGSHVKAPKKRAPFYKKIMKKMRASPRTTIMLGDNEDADITPAKSLGITTIRVKQGKNAHEPSKADVVVRHLGGAHQAIKELLTSK